jgi:hypothetical protein
MLAFGLLAGCQRDTDRTVSSKPTPAHYTVEGTQGEAEHALVSALVSDAQNVLGSPAFRRNLLAFGKHHPAIFAKRGRPDIPFERFANEVGAIGSNGRFASTRVVLTGRNPQDEDYLLAGAGEPPVFGGSATVRLGRGITAQYRSADLVQKSCAINTVSHELSHTISLTPVLFTRAFEDTRAGDKGIIGRTDPLSPVASYLVGTVAQCTWLESKGRIPSWAVRDCINVFGTRAFNFKRCTAFVGQAPVQPGVDVPGANDPL